MKMTVQLATVALFAAGLFACGGESKQKTETVAVKYPETAKEAQKDDYFGATVADPYRWLEDDTAARTADWVKAQNVVTSDFLAKVPFRNDLKARLEKLFNYERFSAPFKEGGIYFFYKNDGLQNQSVLYMQKSLDADPETLLDPNKLSTDGTVAMSNVSVSKDGKYLAYSISRSGSDWQEINVLDIATKQNLSDKVEWVKFSGISWLGNGFYYSRYDAPKKGDELKNANTFHKVYFHKVGTPQSADQLVYEDKKAPNRNLSIAVTDDNRFLILSASEGTSGNTLAIKDLKNPKSTFVTIINDFKNDHYIANNEGDELWIVTNLNAPNQKIVKTNIKNPVPANWTDFVGEQKEVLSDVSFAGGKMFLSFLKDAQTKVFQYDLSGKQESELQLPTVGTAGVVGGKKEDKELFYTFTSFTFPTSIYRYDIAAGTSALFRQPKVDFTPSDYETKQVFYSSKDGTKIPMFIVHKKGLALNGDNATLLYAYGGFNISLTPSFSASRILWLENGGVYAMANLRGGGEYGEVWHKGGMMDKKQNVFDDFIAAAEYLQKEKYTSKDKLAISGGSNGGLLVGATMTQRPDLMKVALPAVGVMDMLRFHKFTIGWAWAVEYGSADSSKTQFETLRKYSPLHNIKEGTNYPATLVTTADHDDRVVPAHSFKFISELQAKHKGDNPVMIRIDTKAGHGAGKPVSKQIEESADVYSFTWFNMGIDPTKNKKIQEKM